MSSRHDLPKSNQKVMVLHQQLQQKLKLKFKNKIKLQKRHSIRIHTKEIYMLIARKYFKND